MRKDFAYLTIIMFIVGAFTTVCVSQKRQINVQKEIIKLQYAVVDSANKEADKYFEMYMQSERKYIDKWIEDIAEHEPR